MDLSIVVVNWNTRALLAQCLESVEAYPPVGTYEVWVVDNASTDGSATMVRRRFPWVRFVENAENVGFARANNQAVQCSEGRHILLLNSDAQLVPGAVSSMLQYLDSEPSAGIVGVCLAFPDGTPQFCYGSFPSLYREFRSLYGLHRWDLSCFGNLVDARTVDWVSGACLMARRTTLSQIGPLDESFFMFGEEVDLCYRAVQAGWKVCLVPSLPVVHVRAGSSGKTSERLLRLYHAKLHYARKHFGRLDHLLLVIMILSSTLGKLLVYSTLSLAQPRMRPSCRLWWRVLRGTPSLVG